ncbi:ABA4-like family protein [Hoyosella subflava]|uniref:DUF4281 domain-containing protein n=1 Tax=Hoyosella subflava (strain DSM 45089 / JCM 17490 / NBRC 109087 / DQS3-9A1) TaxID=443218 RepID=F6EGF3_HOYSD|nr:ABA4-like family protein [Hoyosella subflava]AEF41006.1 hypothetical protein AS9A_2559 [Hoyosella subflava DQS3-9A1]
MTELLFTLSFLFAAPFWAMMILAPRWSATRRIIASPFIVVPSLSVCLFLIVPLFPEFWALVVAPDLTSLQQYVARPEALAGLWAQVIAWDLMIGRWIYLDSRDRRISPWLMAPVLFLAILLSPFVLPLYFVLRYLGRNTESDRSQIVTEQPSANVGVVANSQ